MNTIYERVADRHISKITRLRIGPAIRQDKATEVLRRSPLKPRNNGTYTKAVISAGFYAKKLNKTMYVYLGNSFMHEVWQVTEKESDALNPINNSGMKLATVTPDLTVSVHEVTRPEVISE